jgi:hypothetical protein
VLPRDPDAGAAPSPFSLAAKIEPLYLISISKDADDAAVTDLTADLFYQGFARILF